MYKLCARRLHAGNAMMEVFDVLLYLLNHYSSVRDKADTSPLEPSGLADKLKQLEVVRTALEDTEEGWGLKCLTELKPAAEPLQVGSLRIYAVDELQKLDVECRGALLLLEQLKVIDAPARELVIQRLMHLNVPRVRLPQLATALFLLLLLQPQRLCTLLAFRQLFSDSSQLH